MTIQKIKIPTKFISTIMGGIVLGIIGLIVFSGVGGNNCDVPGQTCNCFCCSMFGMRGYEACGLFGAVIGFALGVVMVLVYRKLIK